MKRFSSLATLAVVSAQVFGGFAMQSAQAAVITWGSATTISGTADVDTVGTLFQAANFAGTNTTVNGVLFSTFNTSGSQGNFNFNAAPDFRPTLSDRSSSPFAGLPAAYKDLLKGMNIAGGSGSMTISGLTLGAQYSIQWWSNSSRINDVGRTVTVGVGSPTARTLSVNTGGEGGLGQWVRGTFTADATTQSFNWTSSNHLYANAMQVRTVVVPEPETLAGLGVIGGGLAAFIRRRFRTVKSAS